MSDAAWDPTSVSLLEQLKHQNAQEPWRRFVQLYTPLLFLWARRVGADEQDAPDLVQEVFLILAREMPAFSHDPRRRFRGWLWTVLLNKWRDQVRQRMTQPLAAGPEGLATLAGPDNVAEATEEEHSTYLVARAIELMQAELPADDWRACHEYLVKGRPAGEVSRELGMTVNQIYLVKSRILRRLRTEFDGLLD